MDGGLRLEVWTNKGPENPLFVKDEHMQIYVRINMPSSVRLIYIRADGTRVLLLDNCNMDAAKLNIAYKLPDEIECHAPFGAEVLHAFARTGKFDHLKVKKVNGNEVLTGTLPKILASTRKVKKATQNMLQTETRVIITTMDK